MLSVFIYKFHKTLFLIPFDMTMCVGVCEKPSSTTLLIT